jgi:hypothetical protein
VSGAPLTAALMLDNETPRTNINSLRAAHDLGYKCLVPADACATRDAHFLDRVVKARYLLSFTPETACSRLPSRCSDVHAAYLAALNFAFAKVVSTDDAIKAVAP